MITGPWWTICAEHPITGEPIGIVFPDYSEPLEELIYTATSIQATYKLLGLYVKTGDDKECTAGLYLFTFSERNRKGGTRKRLGFIYAQSLIDARIRMICITEEGELGRYREEADA